MDVSFFEEKPFYSKTDVQGENRVEEHHFWSYLDMPSPAFPVPVPTIPRPESMSTPKPVTPSPIPMSITPSSIPIVPVPESSPVTTQEKSKNILVYSRRQKAQKEAKNQTLSQQCQEANLDSQPTETHTGNAPLIDDLNQPIALRKGTRSCTLHPISNFVSYKGLSPNYKAFVTALTDIQIPKSIQKALSQPQWKKAVLEEMEALKKNNT